MKKFSKKSLLSFLTVSAIVVTTVGSFAVWDQLTATKTSADITFKRPVETVMQDVTLTQAKDDPSTYTGIVEVKSDNLPAGKYQVVLNSKIEGTAPAGVTASIGKDDTATVDTYTDASYLGDGTDSYTIVVKADRDQALNWTSDSTVQATVTATVSEATAP